MGCQIEHSIDELELCLRECRKFISARGVSRCVLLQEPLNGGSSLVNLHRIPKLRMLEHTRLQELGPLDLIGRIKGKTKYLGPKIFERLGQRPHFRLGNGDPGQNKVRSPLQIYSALVYEIQQTGWT